MSSIGLILIASFLALNMGVSGFSVAFAPSYGSRILTKYKAALLYSICVLIGASLLGPRVVYTLANRIAGTQFSPLSGALVLLSTGLMLFLSNSLRIPQSTSFVTVAGFMGAGWFYGTISWGTLGRIMGFAALFSGLSFFITYYITKRLYPTTVKNMAFYEKFHNHKGRFKKFIVSTDMWAAFGIGTNNVANVVAPVTAGIAMVHPAAALLLAAPLFGFGAYISGDRVLKTVSRDIVPMGEISAAVVSFVTASFVIFSSLLGLPAPYVQFATFSVLAISCVKDGARHTLGKALFKKIILVWVLVPVFTGVLSFWLHRVFIK